MGRISNHKLASKEAVLTQFKDGQSIMIGGFNKVGVPGTLVRWLAESQAQDLTLIVNNCSNAEGGIWYPAAKMIRDGRVSNLKISFTATNTDLCELMESGKVNFEIIPQGTLAERIRAGGFGLGGFLTTVGLNTFVAEGKQHISVGDQQFLLELPLRADVSLVKASVADRMGNGICLGTSKNFNTVMAPAGNFTILEAEKIVEVGELSHEHIDIPGIFVNMLVQSEEAQR